MVILFIASSCGNDPANSDGTVSFASTVLPQEILDLGTDNLEVEGEIRDQNDNVEQAAKVMNLNDDDNYTLESTVAAGTHTFVVTVYYTGGSSAFVLEQTTGDDRLELATAQTDLNNSFSGTINLGPLDADDFTINEENLAEAEADESS